MEGNEAGQPTKETYGIDHSSTFKTDKELKSDEKDEMHDADKESVDKKARTKSHDRSHDSLRSRSDEYTVRAKGDFAREPSMKDSVQTSETTLVKQEESSRTETVRTEVHRSRVIRHSFIVYVPDCSKVELQLKFKKGQDKAFLLTNKETHLWYTFADVQENAICTYTYKAQGKKAWFSNSSSTSTRMSLSNGCIHRHIFDKSVQKGFVTHIRNILSIRKNNCFDNLIGHIESLTFEVHPLEEDMISTINETVSQVMHYNDNEERILIVLSCCYLYQNPSCRPVNYSLRKVTLSSNVSNFIINAMKEFPSSCIPVPFKQAFYDIFTAIVDKNIDNRSLDQLVACYAFFGRDFALELLANSSFRDQLQIIEYPEKKLCLTKKFFSQMLQQSKILEKEGKEHELITELIDILPLQLAFKLIDIFISEGVCDKMMSRMKIRIESVICSIKESGNFHHLRLTWDQSPHTMREDSDISSWFEEAILHMIEKCLNVPKHSAHEVMFIVSSKLLFKHEKPQIDLLHLLCKVKSREMNEILVSLHRRIIPEVYQKLPIEYIRQWYRAIPLSRGTKRLNLRRSCKRFLQLLNIQELMQRPDMNEFVRSTLQSDLTQFPLKEKVLEIMDIEQTDNDILSCTTIRNALIDIISTDLSKVSSSSENLDILRTFCRVKGGHITVNTELEAKLICSVMKTQKIIQGKHSNDETIIFVNTFKDFWSLIFGGKGEQVNVILNDQCFIYTQNMLKNILERIRKGDVSVMVLTKLKEHLQTAVSMLSLVVLEDVVRNQCNKQIETLESEFQLYENVRDVVFKVKERVNETADIFIELEKKLRQNKSRFEGNMRANQLKQLWNGIEELPKLCKKMYETKLLESDVFWILFHGKIAKELVLEKKDQDKHCEKLANNADSESFNGNKLVMEEKDRALEFLEKIEHVGFEMYKNAHIKLGDKGSVEMKFVLTMFGNKPNLEKEQCIHESVLPEPLPDDIWRGLNQVYSATDLAQTVTSMKKSLCVLDIDITKDDEFSSAVKSFDQLFKQHVDDMMFSEVSDALSTIFFIVNELSSCTKQVIECIAGSSSLIEFLRETMDEDIKYLIDAVEEFSEMHVQESTVSGLMEIKGFLYPILSDDFRGNCCELFLKLQELTENEKHKAALPGKIEDCMDNFHNLKSLYKNFANRGEQTKEIVNNIIDRGFFLFYLNQESHSLSLDASYHQTIETMTNGNITDLEPVQVTKSKDILLDLRSRSLLLMNTERNDTERSHLDRYQLGLFAMYIEECLELIETLSSLHFSGHFEYECISMKIKPSELKEANTDLKKKLEEWKHDLETARNQYFLLNYIHGSDLHLLQKYFNKLLSLNEVPNVPLNESIKTLLIFVHPHMHVTDLQKNYLDEISRFPVLSISIKLQCMGYALHKAWPRTQVKRKLKIKEESKSLKMTDVVQKGTLFVSHLEENSKNTVKTVLALYANTTGNLPEPNHVIFCTRETTFDELNLLINRSLGERQFIRDNVTENVSERLIEGCEITQSLFCIANVEMLQNEIQFNLLELLRQLTSRKFLLALVCRGSRNHPVIDVLSQFVTTVSPATDNTVRDIFNSHCPAVYTVTSDLAGLGKSTFVQREAHKKHKSLAVLQMSGCFKKYLLVQRLLDLNVRQFHVLHIDIGNIDDPNELDTFLFELIILGYVRSETLSFALVIPDVFLEISNTINNNLRDNIQTSMLFKRKNIQWYDFKDFAVSRETQSPVQVVCRYLKSIQNTALDKVDIVISDTKSSETLSAKTCKTLLRECFKESEEMSFSVVLSSVRVLSDQLKKMSCSPFFKITRLKDMEGNKTDMKIKSTLVSKILESTKEFASRSVTTCRDTQASTIKATEKQTKTDKLNSSEFSVSAVQRVEGMIRWEDSNHLMFVFHNQNIQTLSPFYREISLVPLEIKELFERQMGKKLDDFKRMNQNQLQDLLQKVARTNPLPIPKKELVALSKDYALTPDNLLKMVLIILRIKAKVPVVIMGETGCGKTSLVRYLATICEKGTKQGHFTDCDAPFEVMNIHAGVSEEDIVKKVSQCNASAAMDLQYEKWLFLDEINTSESISILSDIICHHKCLNKQLSPNLVILAACNPYKLRSSKAIVSAGLTGKTTTDELSRLVYRVLPLPEKMVDYVWDFGSLNENDERLYIERMVDGVFTSEQNQNLFVDFLSASQCFVRLKEDSTYVVSLRDVSRCKRLTIWFMDILEKKENYPQEKYSFLWDRGIRAMVLALAHCYHSRFVDKDTRENYRELLTNILQKSIDFPALPNSDYINDIINEEQFDFLSRMEVPEGTARNAALMENVFVILVCIFNKIPVFVVGKPGCSKSLAMQIIRSNLRGKDSKNEFFKQLPQFFCVSFQGSESSSSEGIIKVFKRADNYQKSNSEEDVLSVVILDEIGLAEMSRFNPLKVLHSLLEADGKTGPNVAVVGISNWALDASKMNRAIHLSRPDMEKKELYDTAISISASFMDTDRPVFMDSSEPKGWFKKLQTADLKAEFKWIAECYKNYSDRLHFKNFHGLRDFYALIKYVAKAFFGKSAIGNESVAATQHITKIVMGGLERNFGGLPEELNSLYEIFNSKFNFSSPFKKNILDLIKDNVQDHFARHLMLITKGDSALGILEKQLQTIGRLQKNVIFGSQFDDDLTDDYNYRILSKIIMCMEQGVVLILRDLDNVYGSLYDMLNQNYTMIGKKKSCRVALGAHSNPICHVADTFRCIVLMDESKLSLCDPPFLNRFEKQYLSFSNILRKKHVSLIESLQYWIIGIRDIQKKYFEFLDIFPIFSEDLLASLIWKIETECVVKREGFAFDDTADLIKQYKDHLLWILRPEAVLRLNKAKCENIRAESYDLKTQYFELPIHNGIESLFSRQMKTETNSSKKGIMTIVFTNSNVHIKLPSCFGTFPVQIEKLGGFKSEKHLSSRIQSFWSSSSCTPVLIVQCSAVDDENHIILTKSIIERYKDEFLFTKTESVKHVYLVIHLDRSKGASKLTSQINFVSDWKLVMMDTLECSIIPLNELCNLDLLKAIEQKRPLNKCLTEQLFWAFTRIKYGTFGRDIKSIQYIIEKMKSNKSFMDMLDTEIWNIVSSEQSEEKDWQECVACDVQALRNSSSFSHALEQYIINVINKPLAKLIYGMEIHGLLDSYFLKVNEEIRHQVWKSVLTKNELFSVKTITNETGPECYVCDTPDLSLKMPFSKIVYDCLEGQKDTYIKEISITKAKFELEQNEELPQGVIDVHLKKQEKMIDQNILDFIELLYKKWEDDYIHDFCNILSHAMYPSMESEQRTMYMKWIVHQNVKLDHFDTLRWLVSLHTSSWVHSSLFRAEMQLFGICEKVMEDKHVLTDILKEYTREQRSCGEKEESKKYMAESQNSNEQYAMSPNDFIVHNICKRMLPSQSTIQAYKGMTNWQRKINSVLALAAKVSKQNKEQLHSLRICNEIASSLIIPLKMESELLENMGCLLFHGNDLDSQDVFDCVIKIFSVSLKISDNRKCDKSKCYEVLSSYLVRCYNFNINTEVLDKTFELYHEGSLKEDVIPYLKAPLFLAFDLEIDEINNLIEIKFNDNDNEVGNASSQEAESMEMELPYETKSCLELHDSREENRVDLSDNDSKVGNKSSKGAENMEKELADTTRSCRELHDSREENRVDLSDQGQNRIQTSCDSSDANPGILVRQVNKMLTLRHDGNEQDSQLCLLFVDILCSIFRKSIQVQLENQHENLPLKTVMICKSNLSKQKLDISMLASLAYIKAFAFGLRDYQLSDRLLTKDIWRTMEKLLSNVNKEDISIFILMLFLKSISWNFTICRLRKLMNNSKAEFVKFIPWTDDFEVECFERSPLSTLVKCNSAEIPNQRHLLQMNTEITPNSMVKKASENPYHLLAFFNFTMSQFYYPKSCGAISDSKRSFATSLTDTISVQKCSWAGVAKYFCGLKDFAVPIYNIGDEKSTDSTQCCMISVFMSLYMVLISNNVFQKKKSLFTSLLLGTSDLRSDALPGFIDKNIADNKQRVEETGLIYSSCVCGFRIACQRSIEEELKCCFCPRKLRRNDKCLVTDTGFHEMKRKFWRFCGRDQFEFAVRRLHPVTSNILQMLVKSCLLGSLAFNFAELDKIQNFTGMEDIDSDGVVLWRELQSHWQIIASMLSLNDNTTAVLMHKILFEAKELILDDKNLCTTDQDREMFEDTFEDKIKDSIKNRSVKVGELLMQHNDIHHITQSTLETQIFVTKDDVTIDRNKTMPLLFRVNEPPSKDSFLSEFYWHKSKFPLINLFIQYEKYLDMPIHIYNIVKWHIATVSTASYVLKRFDCQEMTVDNFIAFTHAKKGGTKLEKIFENFKDSWNNYLMTSFHDHKISSKMAYLSTNSKMKECLIDSKKSILYEVLNILLQIQNEFLDKTLQIANRCNALYFLSRDENTSAIESVLITEVKTDDLIHLNLDWDEMLDGESHCVLEHDQGCHITYDFRSIENMLAVKEIAGKSYVGSPDNLPKIMFTDELFLNYADLLIELKTKVPQQKLADDVEINMRAIIREDQSIARDLLTHLGILMTLLKKTGDEEENKPLVVYANEWGKILTHEFPRQLLPIPETCIHLCHVVALSDLLEEICADVAIDSLEMEYRDQLDQNINRHVIVILDKKQFSLALLLAMKIFAHRSLSTNSADGKIPLCKYLSEDSFWPNGSKSQNKITINGKSENLLSLLPNYIMVRHVYCLVKKIEFEIQIQQEEHLQLTKLHLNFRQSKVNDRSQQKKNQKLSKASKFRDY